MTDDARTFTCSNCQGTFRKGDDDQGIAEYEAKFNTKFDPSVVDVLCDDCNTKFEAWMDSQGFRQEDGSFSDPEDPEVRRKLLVGVIRQGGTLSDEEISQALLPVERITEVVGEAVEGHYGEAGGAAVIDLFEHTLVMQAALQRLLGALVAQIPEDQRSKYLRPDRPPH